MRRDPITLTEQKEQWLAEVTPKSVPPNVTRALLEYYIANKPTDSEWCVLPVTNIEAYLGSSALNRMYMKELNGTFLKRNENARGLSAYQVVIITTSEWRLQHEICKHRT